MMQPNINEDEVNLLYLRLYHFLKIYVEDQFQIETYIFSEEEKMIYIDKRILAHIFIDLDGVYNEHTRGSGEYLSLILYMYSCYLKTQNNNDPLLDQIADEIVNNIGTHDDINNEAIYRIYHIIEYNLYRYHIERYTLAYEETGFCTSIEKFRCRREIAELEEIVYNKNKKYFLTSSPFADEWKSFLNETKRMSKTCPYFLSRNYLSEKARNHFRFPFCLEDNLEP